MAHIKNLVIDQGSTYSTMVRLLGTDDLPYDFTGYTFTAQIRKAPTSQNIAATFGVLCPIPTDGRIYLTLTDEQTALIKPGRYQYDVVAESSIGEKYRVIEGLVTVTSSITR